MSSDRCRNAELECLRLASDLMEMGRATLNPELRSHCIRMTRFWNDRACRTGVEDASVPGAPID